MQLISNDMFRGKYEIQYSFTEEELDCLILLDLLENCPDFDLDHIEILEAVELDMQSISGMRLYPESFRKQWHEIESMGQEISYGFHGSYKGKDASLYINERTGRITIFSTEPGVDKVIFRDI